MDILQCSLVCLVQNYLLNQFYLVLNVILNFIEDRLKVKINGSISTGQLQPLLAFHFLPINRLVLPGSHREHSS